MIHALQLFLESISLQFTAREINENFMELFGFDAVEGAAGASIVLTTLMIIFGFFGFLFFVYKFYKMETEYAGKGEPYGKLRIVRMDGEEITVNLSKNENFFTEHNFQKLLESETVQLQSKSREQLRHGIKELKKWVDEEKIYVYDAKVIRMIRAIGYGVKRYGGKGIIISSEDLLSNEYSWFDKRQIVTLSSFPRKEKIRKVIAHYVSDRTVIKTVEKNKMNVWCVVPVPKTGITEEQPKESGFKGYFTAPRINLTLNKIGQFREITQAAVLMEVYAETYTQVQHYKTKSEHLGKLIEEITGEGVAVALERDLANFENLQQELVGTGSLRRFKDSSSVAVWMLAAGLAGIVGYEMPNEISVFSDMPQWMSGIIFTAIMIFIYSATNKKSGMEKRDKASIEKRVNTN